MTHPGYGPNIKGNIFKTQIADDKNDETDDIFQSILVLVKVGLFIYFNPAHRRFFFFSNKTWTERGGLKIVKYR